MGTGRLHGKVIQGAGIGRDDRLRQARYAILIVGRMQAVPVNGCWHRELVFQENVKGLVDYEGQPLFPVGLFQSHQGRRFAIDLERSRRCPQPGRIGRRGILRR
jgi:hypothetical protein